ncbi:hypothetical protein HDU86_005279 [Geranomyces michiganensis]|nr:hypothetical protein HDU86_005279 [Geranomyces michiganensis]
MRLKFAESFEALKDTVKGAKNKINPDSITDASPFKANIKHARSSDALNEPIVSPSATMRKMRGSTSASDLLDGTGSDQAPSPRRSVKEVEGAGGTKSASFGTTQLFPRGQSASVPDMLAGASTSRPSSKSSFKDTVNAMDAETAMSGGGPPASGNGRDRRSTASSQASASPGGKRGRRVSYGIFFKPGFMRTSASVEPPPADIRLCVEEEEECDDSDELGMEEEEEEEEEEGNVVNVPPVANVKGPAIRKPSPPPLENTAAATNGISSSTALPHLTAEDEHRESRTFADAHTTLMLFGPLNGSEQSIRSVTTATGAADEPPSRMAASHSVDSLAPTSLRLAPHLASLGSLNDNKVSTPARLDSSALPPQRTDASVGLGPFVTTVERLKELQETLHPAVLALLDIRQDGWWLETSDAPTLSPVHFLSLNAITAAPVVTMESSASADNGKPLVASGTLPALVQLLASEGATDSEYLLDFLTTYRYFAQSVDVARLLIMRYMIISTPSGDQKAPLTTPPAEAWAAFLQLKILNVFKKWIDVHPTDFTETRGMAAGTVPPVRALLAAFLTHHVARDEKRAPFATAMLKNLQEKSESSAGAVPPNFGGPPVVRAVAELALPRPLHHGSSEPNLAHGRRTSSSGPGGGGGGVSTPRGSAVGVSNAGATLSRTMSPLTLDTSIRSRTAAGAQGSDTSAHAPAARGGFSSLADIPGTALSSAVGARPPSAVTSPPPSDLTTITATSATGSEPPSSPNTAEFDPDTLAHQLTLLEHQTFKSIQPRELFHQAWNAADKHARSPHLTLLIAWFNRIAYGVATQVVTQQDFKTRVTLLKRFIHVAHMCYAWGNFNTVFEIVAGLNVGPVTRLKRTWKALPKKYGEVWNQLNAVVSSENSYKTYRAALRTLQAQHSNHPILPYLGVNLSDLTFAEDGNPTHLAPLPTDSSPGATGPIINFSKFRLVATLVRSVGQLQARGDYTFPPDPRVQNFLLCEWGVFDDAELYEASKIVEPRLPAQ